MSERVQVYIRFRPENEKEQERGGGLAVQVCSEEEVDVLQKGGQAQKTFTFDHIFKSSAQQEDVYDKVGVPVVESVLQGYNGTILAYGQTGSGKTHTMMGPEGGTSAALEEDSPHFEKRGLVPRIIAELLSRLESQPEAEVEWNVTVSCFELYMENIRDLISSQSGTTEHADVRIREDRGQTGRGVYVENLTEVHCKSPTEIFDVVRRGMRNKHVASTGMNDTSSRSHTLIMLWVTQVSHVQDGTKTVGRLNLVDLAGSERIGKTGVEGERLKEAQKINLSLTLLGNVINKLTDGKSLHIPYRDSKLTRILQDSFGGNSRTLLLCNCSPSLLHQSETVSTLGFANRAKQIQNKPRVNKEMQMAELQVAYERAQEEIRLLKDRIVVEGSRSTGLGPPKSSAAGDTVPVQDGSEIEELRSEIRSLMRELQETKQEVFDKVEEGKRMQERATFHEKRASEAAQKFNDMKAKCDREKMAADSWMRKYNDLQKEREKEQEQKAKAAPRTKSQPRKGSVGGGASLTKRTSTLKAKPGAKAGANASNSTGTPVSSSLECSTTSPPEVHALEEAREALEEARAGEAQALMRERELQELVEHTNQRVSAALAAVEVAERRQQEDAMAIQRLNAELERSSAKYEEMLERQDKEIGELQVALERVGEAKGRQDKEIAEQQGQLDRIGEARGGSGAGGSVDLIKRLEAENAILYEQNRENAQRLIEQTKGKDVLERALKHAQDKEAKLMRQIELANISADIKHQLLGRKLRATKAAFQQRLLDCFSAESPS